jgi:hypothetical protein
MIVFARLLARLIGFALLVVIAAAGIVAAVFCIQSGHATLSLPALASDLQLPQLRDHVGDLLGSIEAGGPVAILAVLCGLGAVAIGLLLAAGAWLTPRPRRIVLERTEHGSLGSLHRPFAALAARSAEEPDEVAGARARARAGRRRDGGRLRVMARTARHNDPRRAKGQAQASVAQLTDGLPVRVRVTARPPSRRDRNGDRRVVR